MTGAWQANRSQTYTAAWPWTSVLPARSGTPSEEPNTVVAVGSSDEVPLLVGKTLVHGQAAVYVCERFVCQAPVTDPAAL